ncbi:MAG: hypothetical protein GY778_30045, partial [bacterium]|nr:hypothetical protein [bacterium]
SGDGSTVVGQGSPATLVEAFMWQGGVMTGMGDIPGDASIMSSALGISADGSRIVGWGNPPGVFEAFRWTQATGMVGMGDLPGGAFGSWAYATSADGSVIVGQGTSALGEEAFRWTAGGGMVGLGDLPGGLFASRALAVSADGTTVVGWGRSAPGSFAFEKEAFIWQGGTMTGLGGLPGGDEVSTAYGVSADGAIVVGFAATAGPAEAFLWTAAEGMRSLQDILTVDFGLDLTGWQLTQANGISDDGLVIVGRGTNPDGVVEGWVVNLTPACGYALCDVNDDGLVNVADVAPFITVLLDPVAALPDERCAADANDDGDNNALDIQSFTDRLLNPPTGACCDAVTHTCSELSQAACAAGGDLYQGDGTTCDPGTCFTEYVNTFPASPQLFQPGAGVDMADDMTLTAGTARELVFYSLDVAGVGGAPFDVSMAIYTGCPGSGGTLIPGTDASVTGVPNTGSIFTITVDLAPAVAIPDTVWMLATFSDANAGWVVGETAESGTTDDVFGMNTPPWSCLQYFGGAPFAGFAANLQCVASSGVGRGAENSQPSTTIIPTGMTLSGDGGWSER